MRLLLVNDDESLLENLKVLWCAGFNVWRSDHKFLSISKGDFRLHVDEGGLFYVDATEQDVGLVTHRYLTHKDEGSNG